MNIKASKQAVRNDRVPPENDPQFYYVCKHSREFGENEERKYSGGLELADGEKIADRKAIIAPFRTTTILGKTQTEETCAGREKWRRKGGGEVRGFEKGGMGDKGRGIVA